MFNKIGHDHKTWLRQEKETTFNLQTFVPLAVVSWQDKRTTKVVNFMKLHKSIKIQHYN